MTESARQKPSSNTPHFARRPGPQEGVRDEDKGRKRAMHISLLCSVLLLVIGVSAAWLAHRAHQVNSNLTAATELLPKLQSELLAGDGEAAQGTLIRLQECTAEARAAGTDPLWKAASMIPLFGANFAAVTEITVSTNDVVDRAVVPMLDSFASLDWSVLTPTDGKVDIEPIADLSPRLSAAANTVQLSYDRLSAIDASRLIPKVRAPLAEAVASLDSARSTLNAAASAAEVLPPMLGADGPRQYLILLQNSAEIRATGGIPGALAVIRVHQGSIELIDQGSASDVGTFEPAIKVDPVQEQIYSWRLGAFIQSVNLTPDFPTAAQTAKAMWEDRISDARIDGVIALDPVVLANILGATGPIELKDLGNDTLEQHLFMTNLPTALTTDNVVSTLLSDVYREIRDPSIQDKYFAAVAGKVFEALTDGAGNSDQLIQALVESSNEGRVFVWSNVVDEQDIIEKGPLAGAVTGSSTGGASFGAYFNDGTGAKMDYYVRRTVQLRRSCTADGYLQYTLTATLTNTAPANAADALPPYVTGGGAFGVSPGTVQTNFVAYGPDRSKLQTARIDGEPVPLGSYLHGDRPVGILTTSIPPGQSATAELDFTNVVQSSEPALDVTPTIQPMNEVVLPLQGDTVCG